MSLREQVYLRDAHIGIIGTCNFSCLHCYARSSPRVKTVFSLEQLREITVALKRYSIKTIYLGGGEPLLHPYLVHTVRLTKGHGMLPSISTNGSLIHYRLLSELYDIGFEHNLYVSLDGPNGTVNDQIRGRGTFLRALAGLEKLAQFRKIQFAVTMVATRMNYEHALETARLSREYGARFFNFERVAEDDGRASDHKDLLSMPRGEFLTEVEKIEKEFQIVGEYYGEDYVFALEHGDKPIFINSTCNSEQYHKKIPIGISIGHSGLIQFTPMKFTIGVLDRTSSLDRIIERALSDEKTDALFQQWLISQADFLPDA